MPSWPCALHIRQWSHSLPSSRTLLCSHPCVCTDPFLRSYRQCYRGCGRESSAGPRDKAAPSPQRSIGVCSPSAVTVTHSPSGFRRVANDKSSHRWLEKGMPRLRSHGYIQKDPHVSLWPLARNSASGPDVGLQRRSAPQRRLFCAERPSTPRHVRTVQFTWMIPCALKKTYDFRDNKSLPRLKRLQFHLPHNFPWGNEYYL